MSSKNATRSIKLNEFDDTNIPFGSLIIGTGNEINTATMTTVLRNLTAKCYVGKRFTTPELFSIISPEARLKSMHCEVFDVKRMEKCVSALKQVSLTNPASPCFWLVVFDRCFATRQEAFENAALKDLIKNRRDYGVTIVIVTRDISVIPTHIQQQSTLVIYANDDKVKLTDSTALQILAVNFGASVSAAVFHRTSREISKIDGAVLVMYAQKASQSDNMNVENCVQWYKPNKSHIMHNYQIPRGSRAAYDVACYLASKGTQPTNTHVEHL
jgi:hypothetical protein